MEPIVYNFIQFYIEAIRIKILLENETAYYPVVEDVKTAGGVLYTRWGRTICEGNVTVLYKSK